jgi:signal-transduction protein with cAMP-binding, CBS, and nucleotidyltransferase domain
MVSSVRHTQHVQKAFAVGADVVTIPPAVLEKMFNHPLTDSGYAAFEDDIKMMQCIHLEDVDSECVVEPTKKLKDCLDYMTENKKVAIVTSHSGKNGIYTLGDFKRFLVKCNFDLSEHLDKPISDFANFNTVELSMKETYGDARKLFKQNGISHLLATKSGKPIGLILREKISE